MNNLHYDCILETVNLLLFKCLIDPVYHCILKSRKNYHPQFRDTKLDELNKIILKQECIPVGCVPSAAVAVPPKGGLPQCMLGYHPSDQAPPPREQTLPWTKYPPRIDPREQTPPHQTPQTRHPPVDRMTDTCKNITFATSLRTVKIKNYGVSNNSENIQNLLKLLQGVSVLRR